jgi:hypothetical protein
LLADLYREEGPAQDLEASKICIRRFLEAPGDEPEISRIWKKLADVCRDTDDLGGELHALALMCASPDVPIYVVSMAANRINAALRNRTDALDEESQVFVMNVIKELEQRMGELDADDYSRLAWLYLKLHDPENAARATRLGLNIDHTNEHCARLLEKLQSA